MSALYVVTGASGFIASHVVRELLQAGHRVRGTVRSLKRSESYAHLRALPGAERLELVEADLLDPAGWSAVVEGAEVVLHTASPYVLDAKDPQKDLVEPAVKGTENVLQACATSPSVRRVVVTSSMAAVTDEPESDRVLTEADWNEKSSLTRNPYYYSKTLAERAAWDFVKALSEQTEGRATRGPVSSPSGERTDEAVTKPGFDLVVINPFLVIGPSLSPGVNTSNQVFVDLLGGTYPGIMRFTWGFVDVRDVAIAHRLAATTPEASGRYLCAADTMPMREVVELLRGAGYEGYALPKLGMDCAVGDQVVKLSSYFQPKGVGSYLRSHVGRVPRYDNAKIQRELGLRFRDVKQTILDTVADLDRLGHLPARKGAAKAVRVDA
ncbi:MAG: NAD-dependent epimerase/dehydratase family protein [Polyangiales bacterium]